MERVLREKKNFILLAWPLAIAVYLLTLNNSEYAEKIHARIFYRAYTEVMTRLTGWIPCSLGEIIIIAVPVTAVIFIVRALILIIIRRGERAEITLRLFRNIFLYTGIVALWYMISCGGNYYRYEFKEFSDLTIEKSTKEELYELCVYLADNAAKARTETGTPEDSVFVSSYTNSVRSGNATEAVSKLGEKYEVLKGNYPKAKSVFFSKFMSGLNITGVYFPFTSEANVNVDIPDYSRAVTICHELSHIRGFMREDEANYIAYLACKDAEYAEFRYSGYMLALVYAGNRLYSEDRSLYRKLCGHYSEGMIIDINNNSKYWEQFKDTTLSEIGEKVNDTYLKANNQTDGTKSYGRMVDLLLAEYKAYKD